MATEIDAWVDELVDHAGWRHGSVAEHALTKLTLDVVRAAVEIDFVFGQGPIETIAHRNDFRGLHDAVLALREATTGSAMGGDGVGES